MPWITRKVHLTRRSSSRKSQVCAIYSVSLAFLIESRGISPYMFHCLYTLLEWFVHPNGSNVSLFIMWSGVSLEYFFFFFLFLPRRVRTWNVAIRWVFRLSPQTCNNPLSSKSPFSISLLSFPLHSGASE